ncbi:MAG: glycosyltransferase family 2 protein, partial [Desulforhopalus sp.]
MTTAVHIIIVAHNSALELPICIEHLALQTAPIQSLVIVDSGSENPSYLESLAHPSLVTVIKTKNIGFSQANNTGVSALPDESTGMIIFLNPDTFLPPTYIESALEVMEAHPEGGIVSGKLLGFDPKVKRPTGKIDSTGVFRRWYGRWYDRGQGENDTFQFDAVETIPAVCGALMCCRREALAPYGTNVFDPDFFLYKEDIELSLRLRKKGWKLIFDPQLVGYHCRGWQDNRREMSYVLRLTAARNEVLLYRKHPSPYIVWALLKF